MNMRNIALFVGIAGFMKCSMPGIPEPPCDVDRIGTNSLSQFLLERDDQGRVIEVTRGNQYVALLLEGNNARWVDQRTEWVTPTEMQERVQDLRDEYCGPRT